MRIALVTDKLSTGGGLEHMYQLCAGMPDLEFGVFGKSGDRDFDFDSFDNVVTFLSNDNEIVRRFTPDLIHYHHLRPLARLTPLPGRKLFTVHGVHLHKYDFMGGVKWKLARLARLSLERQLYKRMDRLITVSDDDADFLRKHHGVDSTTIYNGIDFSRIESVQKSKHALHKLDLPPGKQLYLMVARFDFPKGHDVLLRAMAIMKRQGLLDSRLFLFAGAGALFSEMQALASALGVAEHVRFLGTRTDAYELMKACDVFVLPSRWEGLPVALIEAMVAGIPAVASRTCGINTVAREAGNNIVLFENGNPDDLARALAQPPQYSACNLDRFRLQAMVDATREAYAAL